jgi:hypothetical protein
VRKRGGEFTERERARCVHGERSRDETLHYDLGDEDAENDDDA